MKYLVTMELMGTPPGPPQETLRHLRGMVIPAHEILLKLEADGKVLAGGVMSGRRGIVLIVEAASNAEVSQLLASLPVWGSHEVEVTPLESFEERLALLRQQAEHLKAAMK